MDHAWLDSLSEDWVSQPRSAGSPEPSLPFLTGSTADSSIAPAASRIPKLKTKKSWATVPDSADTPLSERSLNEGNIPLSQRGLQQPSKLRSELSNSARRRKPRNCSGSSTHSIQNNTMQRRSISLSPKKLNETPEWKRRLIHGEIAYGEQKDLFSPAGLESIFHPPPSHTPSPSKLPPNIFGNSSAIPSSPPPYNIFRTQSNPEPFRENGDDEEQLEDEIAPRQQPRIMKYILQDDEESEFSRDDLSRSSSFQTGVRTQQNQSNQRARDSTSEAPSESASSVVHNTNQNGAAGRTVSGQSDIRNEDLSPIYVARRDTNSGQVKYSVSSVAPEELKRRLEKVREEENEEDNPIPSIETPDETSQVLPDEATRESEYFAHKGGFVNLRRGGYSQEGSFQKRLLSSSTSLPAIDEASMLPEESMQASTPKQLPNMKKTRVSDEHQQPPASQPLASGAHTPPPGSPSKSNGQAVKASSGSPLKLFGTHDTFTNQKLLRRLSQFEGIQDSQNEHRPTSASTQESTRTELNNAFVAPSSPEKRQESRHAHTNGPRKLNSFGEGDLDNFQFSDQISYDSMRSQSPDNADESISLPILKRGSQPTFRFHLEPSPALEENVVVHHRAKYTTTTSTTKQVITTQKGARPGTSGTSSDDDLPPSQVLEDLQTPRKRTGDVEGKRLPKTPLKDPTPKRRRTLRETENIRAGDVADQDSLMEVHQQMQSVLVRKRKDARHENDQQAANPQILAMRQILRPRTPTPSQRSSPAPFLDGYNSTERARKLQQLKIAKIQAELDATDPLKMSTVTGAGQQMQSDSRKGSVTTQDFLDEAKKIMAGIRGKARPQSGLASLEESESENDRVQSPLDEDFEDSYQESTKEPFSRPPSREGQQPVPRLPRKQEDPALIDHLRKYQEMDDMDNVIASSMKSLAMVKEAAQEAKEIDRRANETISRASMRISQNRIVSDPPNIRISENPDMLRKRKHSGSTAHTASVDRPDAEYPSNGSNASSQSTTHSIPTGSSGRSDSRRVILPQAVSQLIPEQVAGMIFDRELNKWIKRKTVSGESSGPNFLPSEDTDDDPFGDIPDLSVDETAEMQRLKAVAARQKEDARVAQFQPEQTQPSHQPQSVVEKIDRTQSEIHATSDISKVTTERRSSESDTKTRMTSWEEESSHTPKATAQSNNNSMPRGTSKTTVNHQETEEEELVEEVEEEVEREISILEDRVDRTPQRRRNVTITFSSPLASVIQEPEYNDESTFLPQEAQFNESDSDDAGNDSIIITKSRGSQRKSSTQIRSALRGASRRLSVGGHQFTARPVSRIDEQDEDSIQQTEEDRNRRSVSVLITTQPAPIVPSSSRQVSTSRHVSTTRHVSSLVLSTPRPSHEIGTLELTPLSDFTVHHADVSLGLDVSYVEQNQRYVMGRGDKKALSLAIKELVEKITEVEPFEPFWEHLKELDLKEKSLNNLHKLDEFCERLEELDVSHNQIGQLDGVPRTLRRLRITHNCLTDLSAWGHLGNLQYIDVSNNDIESLSSFRNLIHLRGIRADNNKIKSLEGVGQLDGLLSLRCRGNAIKLINLGGTKLQRLTELDLKDNQIGDVYNLHELQSLSFLNLENNDLQAFPSDDLNIMGSLKYLKLSGNNLETIDVGSYPNLRLLYLDQNRLGTITGLLKTQHLDSLSVREQQDDTVLDPSFISEAFEVRKLFLSGNLLTTFNPQVAFLNLQYLELANCGIESLPEDFGRMVSNTRVLNLNFNALKDIKCLLGIVRLKKLHLAGNRLQFLKPTTDILTRFLGLSTADLRGNPLTLGFYSPIIENRTVAHDGMDGQEIQDPFTLGRADREKDRKYAGRLDLQTKMLRRVYEILVFTGCTRRLKVLDGLDLDRDVLYLKDRVREQLVACGVVVEPEEDDGDQGVPEGNEDNNDNENERGENGLQSEE